MKNEDERCGHCTFWHQLPGDPMNLGAPKIGLCRARPPMPLVMGAQKTVQGMQINVQFVNPKLDENTPCCGLFEQRLALTMVN